MASTLGSEDRKDGLKQLSRGSTVAGCYMCTEEHEVACSRDLVFLLFVSDVAENSRLREAVEAIFLLCQLKTCLC